MSAQELFEIADYCRRTGLAESTFGRRTVNDGKLISRLRKGGRISSFPRSKRPFRCRKSWRSNPRRRRAAQLPFFRHRQKYLLFVNTCSEKPVVADRVSQELANIHPRPPALRLFDAGVGDGSVLTAVFRLVDGVGQMIQGELS
jgi:hypothetical protein